MEKVIEKSLKDLRYMSKQEEFEKQKSMILQIWIDTEESLCVWENTKFDLDKFVLRLMNSITDHSYIHAESALMYMLNSAFSFAEQNNIPLKLTASLNNIK